MPFVSTSTHVRCICKGSVCQNAHRTQCLSAQINRPLRAATRRALPARTLRHTTKDPSQDDKTDVQMWRMARKSVRMGTRRRQEGEQCGIYWKPCLNPQVWIPCHKIRIVTHSMITWHHMNSANRLPQSLREEWETLSSYLLSSLNTDDLENCFE